MISEALPMISVSLRIAPTLPSIIGSQRKRALERREDRFQLFCLLLEQKKKQRKNERTNQQSLLRTINHAHGLYFVSTSITTKTFRSTFVVFVPIREENVRLRPFFRSNFRRCGTRDVATASEEKSEENDAVATRERMVMAMLQLFESLDASPHRSIQLEFDWPCSNDGQRLLSNSSIDTKCKGS